MQAVNSTYLNFCEFLALGSD